MKRICFALIAISIAVMVCSCFADAADLRWGMTKDEANTIMGEKGEEDIDPNGYDTLLRFKDVKISDLSLSMELVFRNDQLIQKLYGIYEKYLTTFNYLYEALETKYGKSDEDEKIVIYVLDVFGMEVTSEELQYRKQKKEIFYKTWNPSEDMIICLMHLGNGLTELVYSAPKDLIPEITVGIEGL